MYGGLNDEESREYFFINYKYKLLFRIQEIEFREKCEGFYYYWLNFCC